MSVPERLQALRAEMEKRGIDIYMIPSEDYHQSEYVGDHFKAREYISGFNGSAGTVVVTKTEAGLWTDGRYFIQAAEQLQGSTINLMKMGEPGVPTVNEFILDKMNEGGVLGYDGRVVTVGQGMALENGLKKKNATIKYDEDLLDSIWTDRAPLSEEKVWLLTLEQTGESTLDKIARIRKEMADKGANVHVVTTLDEVSWIFNMRAKDVLYTPVVLSYAAITEDDIVLFINDAKLSDEIKETFKKDGITIKPYNDVYAYVRELKDGTNLLIDPDRLNYALYKDIPAGVNKIEAMNPAVMMKAIKNETEIKQTRHAHLMDGVAVTKFAYWLQKNNGKIKMTELSVSDKLEEFRREQGAFDLSFTTIAGYGHHGAIVHYDPTPETDIEIKQENFLLVDSGGQYPDGTTDITRTFAMGPLTDEMKVHYTTTLRGHLALGSAKFMYGCYGFNLDILARKPFWDMSLNYNHGTGHGIGHILSVHEGPAGIRWKVIPEKHEAAVIESGMIISNEPGIYIEGSHGIRIENEVLVREACENEYGKFMEFENLTLVPYDVNGILPELMTDDELKALNDYHARVCKEITPFLTEEEASWLKEVTKPLSK